MNRTVKTLRTGKVFFISLALTFLSALILVVPPHVLAQPPEPVVAIHVSELTQALDTRIMDGGLRGIILYCPNH